MSRTIACLQCHQLKVRCIHDPSDLSIPCARCAKTNKKCVFSSRRLRKLSKGLDTQALQQQIASLKAEIARLKARGVSPDHSAVLSPVIQPPVALQHAPNPYARSQAQTRILLARQTKSDLSQELLRLQNVDLQRYYAVLQQFLLVGKKREELLKVDYMEATDLIAQGLLTPAEIVERLGQYERLMYSQFPMVSLASCGWDSKNFESLDDLAVQAEELRRCLPLLYVTVLAITLILAPRSAMETNLRLATKAAEILSHEVLIVGAKLMELLQCLLLMCFWYDLGELFQHRRYHLINNLCVSLSQDLGLSGCTSVPSMRKDYTKGRILAVGVYASQIAFSLFLKREAVLSWSPYLEDCCDTLMAHPETCKIGIFGKLNALLEKAHTSLHSLESEPADGDDPKTRYIISDLHAQLCKLKEAIPEKDNTLWHYYYSVEAYIFEPSIHKKVFGEGLKPIKRNLPATLGTHVVSQIVRCASSCVSALTYFSALTHEEIALLPLVCQARIFYVCSMMMRLRYMTLLGARNLELSVLPDMLISKFRAALDLNVEVSRDFPCNYFVTKYRLVLALALQTYTQEVREVFEAAPREHGEGSSVGEDELRAAHHRELWGHEGGPEGGLDGKRGMPMMRVVDSVVFPEQTEEPNMNLIDFLLDNREEGVLDEEEWGDNNVWNDLLMGVDLH